MLLNIFNSIFIEIQDINTFIIPQDGTYIFSVSIYESSTSVSRSMYYRKNAGEYITIMSDVTISTGQIIKHTIEVELKKGDKISVYGKNPSNGYGNPTYSCNVNIK